MEYSSCPPDLSYKSPLRVCMWWWWPVYLAAHPVHTEECFLKESSAYKEEEDEKSLVCR